jgi:hypothetical protein
MIRNRNNDERKDPPVAFFLHDHDAMKKTSPSPYYENGKHNSKGVDADADASSGTSTSTSSKKNSSGGFGSCIRRKITRTRNHMSSSSSSSLTSVVIAAILVCGVCISPLVVRTLLSESSSSSSLSSHYGDAPVPTVTRPISTSTSTTKVDGDGGLFKNTKPVVKKKKKMKKHTTVSIMHNNDNKYSYDDHNNDNHNDDNNGNSNNKYHSYEEDGPPADLVVRGDRVEFYTPCPPEFKRRAWIDLTDDQNLHRAFRWNGWYVGSEKDGFTPSSSSEGGGGASYQVLWKKMGKPENQFSSVGHEPWQRYSRIPGFYHLESKDGFAAGFRRFQQQHTTTDIQQQQQGQQDLIYFIPETYRLSQIADRKAFTETITHDKETGRHRPWVLKKTRINNGKGVEILPPNSSLLYNAVHRSQADTKNRYIVQAYICNELTWFGGEKFDLRFFWFVASVDPLIVLYQDGYVRVGGALYNETDFESTGQHLTNHAFRTNDQDDHVTNEDLWRRVRGHYAADEARLSKIIVGDDPVRHVRNQLKEAISTTAAAFRDVLLLNSTTTTTTKKGKTTTKKKGTTKNKGGTTTNVTFENLFGFYGADFIIDADLDVFYVEAQASPGMGQKQDFRIDVFRRLFRPMVRLIEEITLKQEKDPQANLWPLENLGDWEVVYGGDWRYRYTGYQRSKEKAGCSLPAS